MRRSPPSCLDLTDPSFTPRSPMGAFSSNLDSHCLPTWLTERRSEVEQSPRLSRQADKDPGVRGPPDSPGLNL